MFLHVHGDLFRSGASIYGSSGMLSLSFHRFDQERRAPSSGIYIAPNETCTPTQKEKKRARDSYPQNHKDRHVHSPNIPPNITPALQIFTLPYDAPSPHLSLLLRPSAAPLQEASHNAPISTIQQPGSDPLVHVPPALRPFCGRFYGRTDSGFRGHSRTPPGAGMHLCVAHASVHMRLPRPLVGVMG